ncbi:MAG: hypothetical protein KME31_22575 [Tolypothrix carrinoi HA7290-LM1]|jgi:hypothetical protein|nr:hypothetical protein [Tolypothrix carrinoi HA7290-LM1]
MQLPRGTRKVNVWEPVRWGGSALRSQCRAEVPSVEASGVGVPPVVAPAVGGADSHAPGVESPTSGLDNARNLV